MDYEGSAICYLYRLISTERNEMQKIAPFLWFDDQAEEAMNFYTSIFKNSKTLKK